MTDAVTVLQNASIRPSVQRIAIYDYLCKMKNHPTADTVFQALKDDYPTLSRTTCYNTLKLFEENNVVQSIQIEDEAVRYDADISNHLHFKCTKCGSVHDIFLKDNSVSKKIESIIPSSYGITKIQTNLWGLCPKCK
ncbi:MAG: transcriptional repressor [Treponema sp.]|nr:transcriptional repressor [Candidatus Treponema scatequi]